MNQIITIRRSRNGMLRFLSGLTLAMLGFYVGRNLFNHGHWYVTLLICLCILVELLVIAKFRVFNVGTGDSIRILTKDRIPVAFALDDDNVSEIPSVPLSEVTGILMHRKSGHNVLTFQADKNTFTLPAFTKMKPDRLKYDEQDFFAEFIDACRVPNALPVKKTDDGFISLGKKEAKQYLKINALDIIRPKD